MIFKQLKVFFSLKIKEIGNRIKSISKSLILPLLLYSIYASIITYVICGAVAYGNYYVEKNHGWTGQYLMLIKPGS